MKWTSSLTVGARTRAECLAEVRIRHVAFRLVMRDDFDVQACDEESQKLFDHPRAAATFGASVFWIRPVLLVLETLEEFIAHWQITRDQTRRGIVEVRA